MRSRPIHHLLQADALARRSWQTLTVGGSSVATEHDRALRRFVPEVIEDGKVDGEGDGSDVYQSVKKVPERWDIPAKVALMGVRVDGKQICYRHTCLLPCRDVEHEIF